MRALVRVLVLMEKAEMLERMLNKTQDEIKSILITSKDEHVKQVVAEFAKKYGWETKVSK